MPSIIIGNTAFLESVCSKFSFDASTSADEETPLHLINPTSIYATPVKKVLEKYYTSIDNSEYKDSSCADICTSAAMPHIVDEPQSPQVINTLVQDSKQQKIKKKPKQSFSNFLKVHVYIKHVLHSCI